MRDAPIPPRPSGILSGGSRGQISDASKPSINLQADAARCRAGPRNRSYATGAIAALIAHHGVWNQVSCQPAPR